MVADAERKVLGDVTFEQGIKRCIAEREFRATALLGREDRIEVKSRDNGQLDAAAGVVSLLCGHKEARRKNL